MNKTSNPSYFNFNTSVKQVSDRKTTAIEGNLADQLITGIIIEPMIITKEVDEKDAIKKDLPK